MRREAPMRLERSPLIYVLAQARFSAVTKMRDYVPDIQEALRKNEFPGYQEQQMRMITLGPEMKTESGSRWVFTARDRQSAVVLTENFVVYETIRYDVFETFVARFQDVLDLIHRNVNPAFTEQLGLRYVNLIRPLNAMSASDFLHQGIRGLPGNALDATQSSSQFAVEFKTPVGQLLIRSVETDEGAVLPPDLASSSSHLALSVNPKSNEQVRSLDIDHIVRTHEDFDPATLVRTLWRLHEFTRRAFQVAVTPEALIHWGMKS